MKKILLIIKVSFLAVVLVSCGKDTQSVSQFYKGDVITIGHMNRFNHPQGLNAKIGVDAAIVYSNQAKLIPGYQIKIKEHNLKENIKTPDELDNNIKNEMTKVASWLGPLTQIDAGSVQNMSIKSLVPVIFPIVTSINLSLGYSNIYQLIPNNKILATYSLILTDKEKYKKVFVWEDPTSVYSLEYARNYVQLLPSFAHNTTITKYYRSKYSDTNTLMNLIADVIQERPDAIFIPADPDALVAIVAAMAKNNIKGVDLIIGDFGYIVPRSGVLSNIDPADIPKIRFVGYVSVPLKGSLNPVATQAFYNYIAKYPEAQIEVSALYFNATLTLIEGLKRVLANKKSYKELDVFYSDYNKALKSITNFSLLNSKLSINQNGTNSYNNSYYEHEVSADEKIKLIGDLI